MIQKTIYGIMASRSSILNRGNRSLRVIRIDNLGVKTAFFCSTIGCDGAIMRQHARLPSFDVVGFLSHRPGGWVSAIYPERQTIYAQGNAADAVLYIKKGTVKVTVISLRGKEIAVAIRGPGFCGEEALSGQSQYSGSVITLMTCEIIRIKRETLADLLRREIEFANYFLSHLLARIGRVEADLVDHLFNTSEIRLARALLLLANYGSDEGPEVVSVPLNQETLAELIGTTRSRVNFFLNKFRRLGLIDYNGKLEVRGALQDYVSSTRIIH